ncbi:MAG: NAD-dependent epimerase/dehydratase family protein [Nitrosarchaeum sp.]|jgi:UDP-glucose 4-epimerase|nr:NAD-dependent epimerase/dehydratase family protein [Nitrosarchaeum sp.]
MKALVTGGAGFIGSNLVDRLVDMNCEVVVIDNETADCNEKFYWNPKADNYKLDICNYEFTRDLYNDVDCVFHLAAESRLQSAIKNPINAVSKNVVGTCTVLQCAKEAGVNKVIYSSTSSAYGLNKYPNYETDPNDCLNPYSVSKVAGEELCKMYTNLYGLKTVIFRYFNVYGERSPTTGQYAPVIGIFQKQKRNNQSLTIVDDGLQKRDFVYVYDVVNANILAATKEIDEKYYGQVYNVGSGENVSILEIAQMISDDYVFIPPRLGEAKTTLANIDKIKNVFGWNPNINIKNNVSI